MSASSIEMLLGYVEKGVGIAVLSERTCRGALAHREGLVTRVMRNAWAVRRLRTALPADPLRRSRLSEDFLRILEKVVESDEP